MKCSRELSADSFHSPGGERFGFAALCRVYPAIFIGAFLRLVTVGPFAFGLFSAKTGSLCGEATTG